MICRMGPQRGEARLLDLIIKEMRNRRGACSRLRGRPQAARRSGACPLRPDPPRTRKANARTGCTDRRDLIYRAVQLKDSDHGKGYTPACNEYPTLSFSRIMATARKPGRVHSNRHIPLGKPSGWGRDDPVRNRAPQAAREGLCQKLTRGSARNFSNDENMPGSPVKSLHATFTTVC